MTIKLVESTRAQYSILNERLINFECCNQYLQSDISSMVEGENLIRLLDPRKLIQWVKQYHGAGNGFLVLVTVQFCLICYLIVKTAFHKYVTGRDEALAEYYADR